MTIARTLLAGATLALFGLGAGSAAWTLLAQDGGAPPEAESVASDLDARARRAAEFGIDWLVSAQRPNGAWLSDVGREFNRGYDVTTTAEEQEEEGGGHLGVTALAGLAILEGRTAVTSLPRAKAVERAVLFALACAREDGSLWDRYSDFHSQSLAIEFLSKVLLLAPDRDDVRAALWDAVDATLAAQSPSGGWNFLAFMPESDVIVTGLTLRALHAAARAGVTVPATAFESAARFLEPLRIVPPHPFSGGYRYRIRSDHARYSSATLTGIAVESLLAERRLSGSPLRESVAYLERSYGERTSPHLDALHFFGTTDRLFAARALRAASAGVPGTAALVERILRDVLDRQVGLGYWVDDVGDAFATAASVLTLVERD